MKSKRQLLKNWKIYAVLDAGFFPDRQKLLKKFYELLKSPIDALQFRFKELSDLALYQAAEKMAAAAKKKNIPFIINDRPEIAFSLGASGVHLGKSDISARIARKILGSYAIIGKTIRKLDDTALMDMRDVDYVAVGPVFCTPLKPGLKKVSRFRLRELSKNLSIPLIAIGGINNSNVQEVIRQGIHTVAFVRYAITQKDTRRRIEELKKIMMDEVIMEEKERNYAKVLK